MSEDVEGRLRAVESHLTTHEAVCAERYRQINDNFALLNRIVQKATIGIFFGGFTLICGMAAIFIKLLVVHT
jgi:hypothetical protein